MIKFENEEVWGFEHAFRGMRNPMNSWDKSDSHLDIDENFVIGENGSMSIPWTQKVELFLPA